MSIGRLKAGLLFKGVCCLLSGDKRAKKRSNITAGTACSVTDAFYQEMEVKREKNYPFVGLIPRPTFPIASLVDSLK